MGPSHWGGAAHPSPLLLTFAATSTNDRMKSARGRWFVSSTWTAFGTQQTQSKAYTSQQTETIREAYSAVPVESVVGVAAPTESDAECSQTNRKPPTAHLACRLTRGRTQSALPPTCPDTRSALTPCCASFTAAATRPSSCAPPPTTCGTAHQTRVFLCDNGR